MNEKGFYESRGRLIAFGLFTFVLSLVFGGITISILTANVEDWISLALFSFVTILLLPISLILFKKSANKDAAVIIDAKGITINTGFPKFGFIPWEDIDGCIPYTVQGQPFIGFILYDEEKYLNQFTGMKRKLVSVNKKMGYPAVNVAIRNLKDSNGFIDALEEHQVGFYLSSVSPDETNSNQKDA